MRRVNYSDEITGLNSRAAQLANLLQQIESEDFPRVATGWAQLKQLSSDAKSAPAKRDGISVIDPNVDAGNPREEFALLRRKLELVDAELQRSEKLLSDRRAAIAALLA
jgi:hypothetical protein